MMRCLALVALFCAATRAVEFKDCGKLTFYIVRLFLSDNHNFKICNNPANF